MNIHTFDRSHNPPKKQKTLRYLSNMYFKINMYVEKKERERKKIEINRMTERQPWWY